MALIVVLSVMSGFDRELKEKIVGVQPHLIIEQVGGVDDVQQTKEAIQKLNLPGLKSIAPFIQGQAIIQSDTYATGVIIKGVDPNGENLQLFESSIRMGDMNFEDVNVTGKNWFGNENIQTVGRVVLGEELAHTLNVTIGDPVSIISPAAVEKKSIMSFLKKPKSVPFVVGGIFHLGMNDFDSALVLVSLKQGQELYKLDNRVTGMSVRLDNVDLADELKIRIQNKFDSTFVIKSWVDLNRNFFSALKIEKAVMTILLSLIVMVAAFNIISSLTMVVMQKTKDIGVLRAIGATASHISQIFLLEGFVIGVVGVLLGAALGLLLAFNLNPVADFIERSTGLSVFPRDIYYFDQIPVDVNMHDVWVIVTAALVMSILAGLYPAVRAARLKPVEALRY